MVLLPNWTRVCSLHAKQSQSTDTRFWWRKVQCLLQGTKRKSERQASDPLQLGFWVRVFFVLFCFLKGKIKEAGIDHHLVTFLNHSFGSQDVSGLQVSGLVVHGLGAHLVLSLYINDLYNSDFSTLTMLLTTAIFVIWFWLINVQLAQDGGQREHKKGNKVLDREIDHKLSKGTRFYGHSVSASELPLKISHAPRRRVNCGGARI